MKKLIICLKLSEGFLCVRVKSLSKGNNSKRDPLSSSNLRDSTALPLTSSLPNEASFDDNITDVPNEKNTFAWAKPTEREKSPPFNLDHIPSGRAEGHAAASVYSDYYKCQIGGQKAIAEDDFDYTKEAFEQEKTSWMNNNKVESYDIPALEDKQRNDATMKRRDIPHFMTNNSNADDNHLNALLKVITYLHSRYLLFGSLKGYSGADKFCYDFFRKKKILYLPIVSKLRTQ